MKIRTHKKYLKIKKREAFVDQIAAIMDDIDPVGIIFSAKAAGFDYDQEDREYTPEAKRIVTQLKRWNSIHSLEIGLQQIFDYYFDYPDVAQEYYQLMARRLWNLMLVNKGKEPIKFQDDIQLPEHLPPIVIYV